MSSSIKNKQRAVDEGKIFALKYAHLKKSFHILLQVKAINKMRRKEEIEKL